MKENILWRFLFLLFILFIIDLNVWYRNKLDIQKVAYEQTIEKKEEKINELLVNQDEYKETLKTVVVTLYDKEQYINVGGIDNTVQNKSIENLVEAIENGTSDFDIFLSDIENFFDKRKEYIHNIPNIFPVPYSPEVRITSGFGNRIYPFSGEMFFHKGIDITGKDTTKIIATADGIVTDVWIWHRVYGKMARIKHNNGYVTLYAHMDSTKVREGQKVKRGQVIGYMGDTGKSYGVHLHYEVWKDGQLVNPMDYLTSTNEIILSR
jgi:murein DD-endopeptidase MepM/ murein hydrolase activator NlpD